MKGLNLKIWAGLAVLLLLLGSAALAGVVSPWDPNAQNLEEGLAGPSLAHPLGQDRYGRDVLSRILHGSRVSLAVGLSTALFSLLLGGFLGTAAGYLGGMSDGFLVRVMDILLAFPGILLALALMAVLGPSLGNVILALLVSGWVGYTRLARAQVLSLRERDFVAAARSLGAGKLRIILVHLLPNLISPLLVEATYGVGSAIVAEAGLSFLGFGVQPPTPSWGAMLAEGRQFILVSGHLAAFPGLAIMLVVLGFNFLGDGLRDALDPRLSAGRPDGFFFRRARSTSSPE